MYSSNNNVGLILVITGLILTAVFFEAQSLIINVLNVDTQTANDIIGDLSIVLAIGIILRLFGSGTAFSLYPLAIAAVVSNLLPYYFNLSDAFSFIVPLTWSVGAILSWYNLCR